jgi:hypothetical protein
MMQRRDLFRTVGSLGLSAAAMSGSLWAGRATAQTRSGGGKSSFFELRAYQLRVGPQVKPLHDFLGEVYVPLLNKLGVQPVGAFQLTFGPHMPTIYLLSPYESLGHYERVVAKLAEELPRQKAPAAQAILAATGSQPPYTRMETQLLRAFDSMPRLEPPPETAKREPRIFELRVYETPSDLGQSRKMEMFGPKMGELAIFRRVGLRPVLFASSVVGPRQPSFSYMLSFPDLAAREAAWKRFRDDADWQKLKLTPGYTDADIMSNITDYILTPTPYSQI